MRSIFLTLIFSAALAVGQAPSILPVFVPGPTELKAYLNLSDAQVQALTTIQKAQQDASQGIYTQMNNKQQQLNALLAAGSNNATEIGQLTIDINNLRKQLPLKGDPYMTQALAVLTADQKAKLPALNSALQLQAPASEAASYFLINRPQPTPMPFLPALVEGRSGDFTFQP